MTPHGSENRSKGRRKGFVFRKLLKISSIKPIDGEMHSTSKNRSRH